MNTEHKNMGNYLSSEKNVRAMDAMTAEERVAWALDTLPGEHIVTSSFGVQSAVMLHMLTRQYADIPVVLIDTGYLFTETYRFIDDLTNRLCLNLKIYRSEISSAWQEARYGQRWNQGLEGIVEYNQENKIKPMARALKDLKAGTWYTGLRRTQSTGRATSPLVEASGERYKVNPIADWTDRDVYQYLRRHGLPYHPLWEKGYVSIGDVHTTSSLAEAGSLDATRFFGLKRECGLHEM